MKKKIVFITGTRADFGKLKSLLYILSEQISKFEIHIFVTGMHMLAKYGYTCSEVELCEFKNIYKFINQNLNDTMDSILAKSVQGFSDYVKEVCPSLIVVHGDRVEALSGALVGSLNNILVAHIEGGEVSGTVDELIRHAITKMSHLHFVANERAKSRLIQLGERPSSVFVIGSPDLDIMASPNLPEISEVRKRYDLPTGEYGIVAFHPVTTELDRVAEHARNLVSALLNHDDLNYVVIYPNNDPGSDRILNEYSRFDRNSRFRVIPSMRFEYFLTLLKNAKLMIGNSSAGVREAPFYGIPSINVGSRQHNRSVCDTILQTAYQTSDLISAIQKAKGLQTRMSAQFGAGNSNKLFAEILNQPEIWASSTQKFFVDRS